MLPLSSCRRTGAAGLACLLALGTLAASASGQYGARRPLEPWADPGLKVTRGLALWLDAGRLNAARQAHGQPELSDGQRVETWYDASGRGWDVAQAREEARPKFLQGALRFDGEATYLMRAGLESRLKEFTLFVVAAPLSNAGGFRAFAAMHRDGQEDYTSAFNVDQGPGYTGRFDTLNVEGPGFGGAVNLITDPSDFVLVRRLTITSAPGPGGTRLVVDGRPGRGRDREDAVLHADRLLIGARFFGFPPDVHGFLEGDILHVLLYDRALDEPERREVEAYLAARLGGDGPIVRPDPPGVGKPLVTVEDPPPVQVLAPGFSARELPVDLSNVNNVRYRPDGKLVALGYDGNIHLLSDRDGDGLEETVEPFWDRPGSLVAPIGMALTPRGYARGEGMFVASKGKLSLILDSDRDGQADEEIVVASGWTPLPHGVDTLGVALDREGNVYFGLGTTNFTNAYLLDEQGKAAYRLDDAHGTIQKVSPDFSRREIVATGIRFPVGLAFNRLGDLFATDQEGATWLANGNPFDELLHIQPGRHYGFPPRHPTHLPAVIDEPSVFDYTPQHQSTCGLVFNELVDGGPTFGPASWAGDALVTGYSRGKLFGTRLSRTPSGYVALNRLLAVMNGLPADACVSPRGDLVVAAHGGLPDWGGGPRGKGRLFKIVYSDREIAQPLMAWPSGPREVRVAFDRPVDPSALRGLVRRASIEYGQAVSPGDRFESLRPGYEAVGRQMRTPRFDLPILSAQVSADRRALILATPPHPVAASYALTLPGWGKPEPGSLRQAPEVDLGYDLSGVEATWTPEAGGAGWSGWLPHPDLSVARAFTAGSADHDRLWEAMTGPGRLTLRTRVDLWRMLRPAVQPGSTLGYRLPDEEVTLAIDSSVPITVERTGASGSSVGGDGRRHAVRLTVIPKERQPIPLEITLESEGWPDLRLSWTTREDATPRALPLRRLLLPWASLEKPKDDLAAREVPELKGGDWARGRALFYGEQAKCSACHKVRGRGGEVGPDLSNLVHRDYASVHRDVHAPSAAINPDYVAHSVALNDGRVLQGTLRIEADRLLVGGADGTWTTVGRAEVEAVSPSAVSIMPEGLDAALGPERLRDLLTFLLTDPLGPAKLEGEAAPPPRRRAEVEAALQGGSPVQDPRPLRIVLAGGPKDHGPGEHDYPLWLTRWSTLLATDASLSVAASDGWPSPEQLEASDVLVMYSNNPGWDAAKGEQLDRYLTRGGGVVLIHYAVDGHQAVEALAARVGLAWQGGRSAFRHGPLDLDFTGSKHPITRGIEKLRLIDESYWNLVGDPSSIEVLGTGREGGEPRPLFWARSLGEGRVFVSIPGHYTWTFDDPLFRLLILRGMAWTAGEPVDRFNELATLGARIAE
ncbi:ThuA domain-containing protein [Paludisphaera sp.]|uniref:ThuA domain-containing protein n=1 Tax=Paludisphaera sp. TaxID=2017432 RepID=UPI00301CC456